MTDRDPDQEILDEIERRRAAGTEFEGLQRVNARVSPNARGTFSIRLSRDELGVIIEAAKLRGQRMTDFVREAAVQAAKTEKRLSEDAGHYSLESFRADYEELGRKLERSLVKHEGAQRAGGH
jgi:uncharacterized protein (DUF1778 family)